MAAAADIVRTGAQSNAPSIEHFDGRLSLVRRPLVANRATRSSVCTLPLACPPYRLLVDPQGSRRTGRVRPRRSFFSPHQDDERGQFAAAPLPVRPAAAWPPSYQTGRLKLARVVPTPGRSIGAARAPQDNPNDQAALSDLDQLIWNNRLALRKCEREPPAGPPSTPTSHSTSTSTSTRGRFVSDQLGAMLASCNFQPGRLVTALVCREIGLKRGA